jgi:hypothetical protein
MTLRDYFAAKGLVLAFAHLGAEYKGEGWQQLAVTAFSIADEMLAARERK